MGKFFEFGLFQVFTFAFAAEALIKIVALNPIGYIKDFWNLFDFVIVVISMVELILDFINPSNTGSGLTVLRSLRLVSQNSLFYDVFAKGEFVILKYLRHWVCGRTVVVYTAWNHLVQRNKALALVALETTLPIRRSQVNLNRKLNSLLKFEDNIECIH